MLKNKIDFKRLNKTIIDKRVKRLQLLGMEIETDIIQRTQKGKDTNNRPFKRYSKQYLDKRKKKGRSTTPNLTFTEAMLQAITSKKIKNGLRFYFSSNTETKKARYNQKDRRFFGVDPRQLKDIKKTLSKLR